MVSYGIVSHLIQKLFSTEILTFFSLIEANPNRLGDGGFGSEYGHMEQILRCSYAMKNKWTL